ncbi:cysteine desulfurase family protein [Cellulomonas sp. KRMCY2]|uniref:cysteine desulfurase family protein n=1 Tax=Cellulomonas sp. KRMCY2 TaxID=1304865 RepID=UPI00045E952E|nr:cysteine desulfurase family protein [Cellulomonas sp. KRMCY2]
MGDDVVYLDHNATTPVLPEVLEAMLPYLTRHFGNPSSGHALGRQAADAVAQARAQVAELLGARPDEVVFTSGGTEANNLAIRGAAAAADPVRRRIVTSAVEHPATVQPVEQLRAEGWHVTTVPVTATGHIAAADLVAAIGPDVALATVMLGQNETGALMPVAEMAAAARAVGAVAHTDAAQAFGKVPIDVGALGVDLLSIAGHKCYAPKGVGALYVRRGTAVRPVLRGASQEHGLRPGTENVASIVGLGAASALLGRDLVSEGERVAGLRELLWATLSGLVPGLVRLTPVERIVPNTLLVSLPGAAGWDVLAGCPTVAAATGSACHTGQGSGSGAVLAMGVDPRTASGAVRLSLGRHTTADHVARAAAALGTAFRAAAIRAAAI